MNKNEVNDRIISAINYIMQLRPDLSKTTLSDLLGIKNTKFSHIMAKRMYAGVGIMTTLCLKFSISADWLLTGRGNMVKDSKSDTSLAHTGMVMQLVDTIKQQAIEIGQLKERIKQLESEEADEPVA